MKIQIIIAFLILSNSLHSQISENCHPLNKFDKSEQVYLLNQTVKYAFRKKRIFKKNGRKMKLKRMEKFSQQQIKITKNTGGIDFIFSDKKKADTLNIICKNDTLTLFQEQHFLLYVKLVRLFLLEIDFEAKDSIRLPLITSQKKTERFHIVDTINIMSRKQTVGKEIQFEKQVIGTKFQFKNVRISENENDFQVDFLLEGTTFDSYDVDRIQKFKMQLFYNKETKDLQKIIGEIEDKSNPYFMGSPIIRWDVEIQNRSLN